MIYVEFYKDNPVFILPEDYDQSGFDDVREFENIETFKKAWPHFKIPAPRKDNMPQARREAIKELKEFLNGYQEKVVGTDDTYRFERFRMNLLAARAYLNDTASDAQETMLQSQLDANKAAQHPLIKDMTLQQFAEWITAFHDIIVIGSAFIECMLINGRAQIDAATTKAEIKTIMAALKESAETQYQSVMASITGS